MSTPTFRPKYVSFDCYGTLISWPMTPITKELVGDQIPAEDWDRFVYRTTDPRPPGRALASDAESCARERRIPRSPGLTSTVTSASTPSACRRPPFRSTGAPGRRPGADPPTKESRCPSPRPPRPARRRRRLRITKVGIIFQELELLKRSSQACLGTCQGGGFGAPVAARSWS